jgi:WD40 repeat protein
LGEKGAEQVIKSDRRSNEVSKLDVRSDGGQVLFDQGQALQILTLPDWRVAGELKNPAGEARFHTFAKFSPDGKLILTAGGEGQMQLWRAPSLSRGWASEVRNLVAPVGTGAVVDAAFAPSGEYLVTGTQDRKVMVWAVPNAEAEKPLTARITLIDNAVEASGRMVRVWASLTSGDARLMTRSSVTLIAQPEQLVGQR